MLLSQSSKCDIRLDRAIHQLPSNQRCVSVQEEKLAVLVQEFGHLGRRAFKRVANAFPGGFSSAAIKKHVSRLKLELPSSVKRKHDLEDLDGIGHDIAGGNGVHDEKDRKRVRKIQGALEDEVDGCASSGDDDMPCVPATKRRRGCAHHSKGKKPGLHLEAGGSCGQTVPIVSANSALEDDVEIGEGMGPRALVSSDDDWGELAPPSVQLQSSSQDRNGYMSGVQPPGLQVSASKDENSSFDRKKTGNVGRHQAASNTLDKRGNEAASGQHHRQSGSNQKFTSHGSHSKRFYKTVTQNESTPTSGLDMQAVAYAAHHIKDDLKNDGAGFCNDAGCHRKLDSVLYSATVA